MTFYPTADAAQGHCTFSVIAARYQGQWVFVRHKKRDTWEIPGGHLDPGETAEAAARRELWEETGATDFTLASICSYSVTSGEEETFGMLYQAEVHALGPLPDTEIAEVRLFSSLPDKLTYPHIQPLLWEKAKKAI